MDISSLGPVERFRITARNNLRGLQGGQLTQPDGSPWDIDYLISEILNEAKTEGIDLSSGWPTGIDGPFDPDMRDLVQELRDADAEWQRLGKPRPKNV